MSSFGVVSTGFALKTFEEILEEIATEQRSSISATANLSSTSVFGQMNNIFTSQLAEIWELAQAVYNAQDPATATGQALDYYLALVGLTRLPPSPSTVTLEFVTNAGGTISSGTEVSLSSDSNIRFTTDAAIDGTAGAGTYSGPATCTVNGPTSAPAGFLTVLETPVGIVDTVSNPLAADFGRDLETDEDARARRDAALANAGAATSAAITAALLAVSDVVEAIVFENRTNSTNGDGVPAHSIECLVKLGADDDIAQAIYDTACAADGLYSGTADSGTAIDPVTSESQTIPFSRPTDIDMLVEIDISINATLFGSTGYDYVRDATETYLENLPMGGDVIISQLICAIAEVSGVTDVVAVRVDSVAGGTPVASNFSIDVREDANMANKGTGVGSSGDITITVI